MTWQKGQSGNPAGRMFETTLKRAITQCDGRKLRDAADKLLDAAANGEPWAIQMLADRLDGKPKQQVDVKSDHSLTVVLAQCLPDGTFSSHEHAQVIDSTAVLLPEGEEGGVLAAGGDAD